MGTFVPILMMLLSNLVGSIPVGYLIGKSKGIDIRSYGSHNIGATNASRTLGKGYGFIVFLLDFFKAGIFVIISKYLFIIDRSTWFRTNKDESSGLSLPND